MRQQDVFIHAGSAQSRLEISVSCAALPEPDLLGPTDPVVTLSTRLNRSDPWKLVAKSGAPGARERRGNPAAARTRARRAGS